MNDPSLDEAQQQYLDRVEQRVRWADRGMNARSVGQKAAWTIALVAGGAVSLSEAVVSSMDWLPAVLGFVVVVAQGSDRLLRRSEAGSASMDRMRRDLSRENRLFHARASVYDLDDPFPVFVERVEAILRTYDDESVAQIHTG